MSRIGTVWTQARRMRAEAPVVFWSLVVLALTETGAALLGPLVVPDHVYLRGYLSEQAEAATAEFYSGQSQALVYDEVAGWRNRPGFARDNWQLDAHGSRSTGPIARTRGTRRRILFLGNSLTNGGTHVTNAQTVSAAVEDSTTEAVNFATMLYALDQSLLRYGEDLRAFGADVVVVGMSGVPTPPLSSRYVPFRRRAEVNMPYFKPRFRWENGAPELVPVPDRERCAGVLDAPDLLAELRLTDGYWGAFASYKRYGFTPILRGMRALAEKAASARLLLQPDTANDELLLALMHRLETTARADGARVVFMLMPDLVTFAPGWRSRLPDAYGRLVDLLTDAGFTVLDGRAALAASDEPAWALFHADGTHYTPRGNAVLGAALKPLL